MKRNPAVNVIAAILAVLLSIALVVTAFGAVIFHMLSSATKANQLSDFLGEIDYSAFLPNGEELFDSMGDLPVNNQLVNEIMGSDAVKEVIDQYAQGFDAALSGEPAEGLTVEGILQIADENMDELVDIIQENVELEIDEQTLRTEISKAVKENAPELLESLPAPQAILEEMDPQVTEALKTVFDPMIAVTLLIVSLVLAALIYACRWYRFGGFIWIGVDSVIVSFLVGIIMIALNGAKSLLLGILPLDFSVLNAATAVLNRCLLIDLLILIGAAVLFMVLGVVLKRKTASKYEAPSAEAHV